MAKLTEAHFTMLVQVYDRVISQFGSLSREDQGRLRDTIGAWKESYPHWAKALEERYGEYLK